VPGFELVVWFGLAAPSGTPAPVTERAKAALNKVLGDAELRERLGRPGFSPRGSTPAEFTAFLRQQTEELTARARAAELEPQ